MLGAARRSPRRGPLGLRAEAGRGLHNPPDRQRNRRGGRSGRHRAALLLLRTGRPYPWGHAIEEAATTPEASRPLPPCARIARLVPGRLHRSGNAGARLHHRAGRRADTRARLATREVTRVKITEDDSHRTQPWAARRPFLNGERIDPETTRILGVAFEMACIALRTEGADDFVKQAIAAKIINFSKGGERNPDVLCEQALRDIRGQEV